MALQGTDLINLLLALLAGGLIGAEREFRDKAAGFRTLILICAGAALFTMLSKGFGSSGDPARIAAGVVSGIGFLGAGVILRDRGHIVGLTTAAIIWMTAAVGMAIGGGQLLLAFAALALVLTVLWIFPFFERRIDLVRETRNYEIILPLKPEKVEDLAAEFHKAGLTTISRKIVKGREHLLVLIEAYGAEKSFIKLTSRLIADQDVHEFKC